MNTRNRIVLRNIRKSYYKKDHTTKNIVFDSGDIFEIPLSGIVSIIGWSGSGKSTLLNIITLLDTPDIYEGETLKDIPTITYEINDIKLEASFHKKPKLNRIVQNDDGTETKLDYDINEFRKIIMTIVFQSHHLHPNLNIKDNINTPFLCTEQNLSEQALAESSRFFDIEPLLEKTA